jgi:hypothetical protein
VSWIDWIDVIIFGLGSIVFGLAIIIGVGHVIGLWIIDEIEVIKEKRKEKKMAKFRKRKRQELREVCQEMYGDDFVKKYDLMNMGCPIGNLAETRAFLEKITIAQKRMDGKEKKH